LKQLISSQPKGLFFNYDPVHIDRYV